MPLREARPYDQATDPDPIDLDRAERRIILTNGVTFTLDVDAAMDLYAFLGTFPQHGSDYWVNQTWDRLGKALGPYAADALDGHSVRVPEPEKAA